MSETTTASPTAVPVQQIYVEPAGGVNSMIIDLLKEMRSEQRAGFDGMRAEFNARIDRLVGQDTFREEKQRVNDRLAELDRDIAHERTTREAGFRAVEARGDKQASNLRWFVGLTASIVVPTVIFVATMMWGSGF